MKFILKSANIFLCFFKIFEIDIFEFRGLTTTTIFQLFLEHPLSGWRATSRLGQAAIVTLNVFTFPASTHWKATTADKIHVGNVNAHIS